MEREREAGLLEGVDDSFFVQLERRFFMKRLGLVGFL